MKRRSRSRRSIVRRNPSQIPPGMFWGAVLGGGFFLVGTINTAMQGPNYEPGNIWGGSGSGLVFTFLGVAVGGALGFLVGDVLIGGTMKALR